MELLNVAAILVTRGNVNPLPVLDALPDAWERIIWDNGEREVRRWKEGHGSFRSWFRGHEHPGPLQAPLQDLTVFGRYAAIELALDSDLIFVVDDDCIISDPQAIVDAWEPGHVVCNMPEIFRPHYPDSALVGFGACFEPQLPAQAFARYEQTVPTLGLSNYGWSLPPNERFLKCCDVAFTTLTPRILVDVPKTDRRFASDDDRMWKQADHVSERAHVLDLARLVRDAT